MNTDKGKTVITRRAFFRQLNKKTLPFIALLSVSPLLLSSCEKEKEKEKEEADCKNECKSSCSETCNGTCHLACAVACGGSCAHSCINITK